MPLASRATRGLLLGLWAAAVAWSNAAPAPAQSARVQWQDVERVVAFGDVHGAYDELHQLLRETQIIDGQDHWAAGKTHVVSLGDLLDRGTASRQVMDLLMRLQGEAEAAGGQLHVLLGNHEAMNLLGDLRYVDRAEFATYRDLESAAERQTARAAWQKQPCAGSCPDFDEKFPPGYFGRRDAFAPDGKYGKWLLGLPVAIEIDDTMFIHGGLGPALSGMNLQELNLRYHTALVEALHNPAAEDVPLLSEGGPNWYRGSALCNEASESDVLLPLLQQFDARLLVVGHTPTRNGRVVTRFNGRVVKLDAGMNHDFFRGRAAALFIDASGVHVQYTGEPAQVPLQPEGLFVAPTQVEDSKVLTALRDGAVSVTGPHGPDQLDVMVSLDGLSIPAVFRVMAARDTQRELAAWRLDRLLQLGIVPATVQRDIEGKHGVLQARPRKWLTEEQVRRQSNRGASWCSMEPQLQLLYSFDTLVGNESRSAATIIYDTDEWLVYATSFGAAFGRERSLPDYLQARPPMPGKELRRRLARLDDAGLATALGDLLSAGQRRAILRRRDMLLALPAPAASAAR